MILTARRSLVAKVARHQPPQIDIFFLNINVRRNCLVEDSLKEVRRFSYGSDYTCHIFCLINLSLSENAHVLI